MFCCYVNCFVRILLRLLEDKFIHTLSRRWFFKKLNEQKKTRRSSFLAQVVIKWSSTQAHRQKMHGRPGGLKSPLNEAAYFHQCLGEKLLQNNQSLWLLCLWGWKSASLSLILGFFSVLCGKCSEDAEDADFGELCRSAPLHPVRCPVTVDLSVTQISNICCLLEHRDDV